MFKPTPFQIDNDRFYYEPRVLWSVARVGNAIDPQSTTQPAGFVKMDKNHFQNPSKYPFRITHAIVSPVGYLFRYRPSETTATRIDQTMAGLGRVRLRVSFPKRSWIERLDTDVYSFGNVAVAEPSFVDDPLSTNLARSSGLLGVSRWTFDPSYILPQKATINLELSQIQSYTGVTNPVTASMIFDERGGRMLGHGRHRAAEDIEGSPAVYNGDGIAWPRSHVPVIGDFYAGADGAGGAGVAAGFSPTGKWASNRYNHQLSSRGLPYTEVTGFAVALDQIAIDNAANAQYAAPHMAPISQRIITKAKTRDAGTQESWWRDGAPLSLVTPTMNNAAMVHKWEQPFELGPGEYMEVSLQAPPPRTMTFAEVQTVVNPIYNVGVSFLGYAVVEDNSPKVYRSSGEI